MNSKRAKVFILVALTAVMAYLWLGNLSLFSPPQSSAMSGSKAVRSTTADAADPRSIVYRPIKLNPFKRPDIASPQSVKSGPARDAVKLPPAKLAGKVALAGFVSGAPRTQIVLQDQGGTTFTKSLGDTVYNWKLISVTSTMAIFAIGKQRDTLFLMK